MTKVHTANTRQHAARKARDEMRRAGYVHRGRGIWIRPSCGWRINEQDAVRIKIERYTLFMAFIVPA